jgi:ABC-type amino acid transport substrate-binding protein
LWEKSQGVDVAVLIGRQADPEMQVGLGVLRIAASADRADRLALRDRGCSRDGDRAEVDEGDGVAVGRLDRYDAPAARDHAREADDASGRGAHRRVGCRGNVDSAVLSSCVRIVPEVEGL